MVLQSDSAGYYKSYFNLELFLISSFSEELDVIIEPSWLVVTKAMSIK
jgi:hypothetical protein